MNRDDITAIIGRIASKQYTEEDITLLKKLLSDNPQIASQLGKNIVNIGEGKEIQIGDRIHLELNEDAIKALIIQSKSELDKDIGIVLKPPMPSNYNEQTWVGREAVVSDLLSKLQEKTRLLWITGISGIGKTALGECLASQSWKRDPSFKWIYLEILEGQSPDFVSVAADLLAKLGVPELDPQERNNPEQLAKRLLQKFQSYPYWIQMDSFERLLNPEQPTEFIDAYWITFLQRFLTGSNVVSRLVLTAQAFPTALIEFSDRYPNAWAEFRLVGLLQVDQQLELFAKRGVVVEHSNREILTNIAQIYEGHPLVLKVIAEDILNSFAGNVERYWQVYQTEFEQVARELQATHLDETEYNEALDRKVRERIKRSVEQLPTDALDLLCRSAVFRRPVPKKFWLAMIGDRSIQQQKAAYQILGDRALIEKESTDIRQHNLIRSVAYNLLRTDTPTWQQTERQAAHLWLTAYKPDPDAPKLETVRGYLEAFAHYCEVQDWEIACHLLYTKHESGNTVISQLNIWCCFQELVPIYQTMVKIAREIRDHHREGIALNGLGNAYQSLGQYQQAIELYQQYLNITRKLGEQEGEGYALSNIGLAYINLGKYEQAMVIYAQALSILHEIGNRRGEGIALGNIGLAYNRLGNYEQAINYHEQDLAIAREIGDRFAEGIALGNLGNAYNNLGQYQLAKSLYQELLTIAREIGNFYGEGIALCGLGNIYNNLGKYQQSLGYYQQYLILARKTGDYDGEGAALGSLGLTYNNLGQYEQAINYHQQNLTIACEIGDRHGEGIALGNLGIAYNGLGQYEQAINFYQQYLTITCEIGDRKGEGIALMNMGETQLKLRQYSKSLVNNQLSLDICREIGFHRGEAESLKNLGILYQSLGQVNEAREYCQQALALAEELGIPLAAECEALLQEIEEKNKQSKA